MEIILAKTNDDQDLPLSVHGRLGPGRELRTLHDDDGLTFVNLDGSTVRAGLGERVVNERADVLDELVVKGVAEHGLEDKEEKEDRRNGCQC